MAMLLLALTMYIPDCWTANPTRRDRAFFFGILATMNTEFVTDLIEDCRRQRKQGAVDRLNQPRELTIAPEWAAQLLSQPYVSSKCLL